MASGIGGAGGGGRFPLPPENNGKSPVQKKVRFDDQTDAVDSKSEQTVKSASQAFQKLLSEGSSTEAASKPHVISKDLGARPKERKAATTSGGDWSDISAQAAKAAIQWQRARGGGQEQSSSDESSSRQEHGSTSTGSTQASQHMSANLQRPSAEAAPIATPRHAQPLAPQPQSRPTPPPLGPSSHFSSFVPESTSSSLPSFTSGPKPTASRAQFSSLDTHGHSRTEAQGTRSPSPSSRSSSPVGREEAVASVRPVLFSRIQLGLMELELDHVENMEESFRIVEDSAKTKDDVKWCRDQVKKYAKARQSLEKKVEKLKIHVSESEEELDDLITSRAQTSRIDLTAQQEKVDDRAISSSLAEGAQSLEALSQLNQAFDQLAASFKGAKLQFATLDDKSPYQQPASMPHYQTPATSPHYQTPTTPPHYQTPASVRSDSTSREDRVGTSRESESLVGPDGYLLPDGDDDYVGSTGGYVEPEEPESVQGASRTQPASSSSRARELFASLIRSIRSGLALLCARIRAGFQAAAAFIHRHCRYVDFDEEGDNDAYQVLGYRDEDDYLTMQRHFQNFLRTAYGEEMSGRDFRMPRAQLSLDMEQLEEVSSILSQDNDLSSRGASGTAGASGNSGNTTSPITSSYALLGFPAVPTQDERRTPPPLTPPPPPPRPNVETVYAEIHTPPQQATIGGQAMTILRGTDDLWTQLMTADVPLGVNPTQYYTLVQELERVLQKLKNLVNVEESSNRR